MLVAMPAPLLAETTLSLTQLGCGQVQEYWQRLDPGNAQRAAGRHAWDLAGKMSQANQIVSLRN